MCSGSVVTCPGWALALLIGLYFRPRFLPGFVVCSGFGPFRGAGSVAAVSSSRDWVSVAAVGPGVAGVPVFAAAFPVGFSVFPDGPNSRF